jgi:hypothetical protein
VLYSSWVFHELFIGLFIRLGILLGFSCSHLPHPTDYILRHGVNPSRFNFWVFGLLDLSLTHDHLRYLVQRWADTFKHKLSLIHADIKTEVYFPSRRGIFSIVPTQFPLVDVNYTVTTLNIDLESDAHFNIMEYVNHGIFEDRSSE